MAAFLFAAKKKNGSLKLTLLFSKLQVNTSTIILVATLYS